MENGIVRKGSELVEDKELIQINLPASDQPNLMEDYNKSANEETIPPPLLIKKFEENPFQYFNFGFNMSDYKAFLIKHIYMRIERNAVRNIIYEETKKK